MNTAVRNGRPARLDDLWSARLVWRAADGNPPPEDICKRLDPEWAEAALMAEDSGESGIDAWLKTTEVRSPDRVAIYRKALDDARADPRADLDPGEVITTGESDPKVAPFKLDILGTSAFARKETRREWLIKHALVKYKPGIIGGPQKALKTSTVIDAVVSLASGGRFLGSFEVPTPTKVLLISGESGEATIQETMRRVCRAKDIGPADLEGFAFWGFSLPQLNNPEQLAALAAFIRENGIEVVIIDPLYLCLLTGGKRIDPANLFDVGPLLKTIAGVCLDAGATPLLVHHFRKNRESPYGPPEMEDLAFSGIQEFARQWLLLSRRERYEPGSGKHKLWITVGGSDGQSGEWALDVDEGITDEDFRDREWNVSINRASEARTETKELQAKARADRQAEQARAKESAKERVRCEDSEKALDALKKASPDGKTRKKWRESLGWGDTRFGPALELLLGQGRVCPGSVQVPSYGGRTTTQNGFHWVRDDFIDPESNSGEQRGTFPSVVALFPTVAKADPEGNSGEQNKTFPPVSPAGRPESREERTQDPTPIRGGPVRSSLECRPESSEGESRGDQSPREDASIPDAKTGGGL